MLNTKVINEIFRVKNEAAFKIGRELASGEGLLIDISSAAAVSASIEIAQRPENRGKIIVVLLPDTGEPYLSTPLFSDG